MSPTSTPAAQKAKPTPKKRLAKTRFIARQSWRGIKVVALLLLLTVVIGSGWIAWTNHRGQKAAEEAGQLIADRASPQSNQDPVADSANGARYYLAAAELLALDEALVPVAPVVGYAAWPEFGDRVTDQQREILREMVEPNRPAFDLCRHARSFEQFDYDFRDPLDTNYNTMVFGKLRRLGRWITIKTYFATAENDLDETTDCLVDIFAISRSMNGGKNMLVELLGMSISALAHNLTEETLSRAELDIDSLARVRDAAEHSLNPEGLANALESEARAIAALIETPDIMTAQMRFNHAEIAAVVEKMIKAGYAFEVEDEPWWSEIAWRLSEAHFVLSPGSLQLQGLTQVKYQFAAADRVKAGELLDEAFIEDAARNGVDYAPANAAAQRSQLKNQAALLTLLSAIDAESFRIREGRWPIDMKELMDGKTIPLDPWGSPLSLLRTDDEIRVYSGRDDHGLLHWKDDDAPEDVDDEHTRLLDPDQRGLVPKPISESEEYEEFGEYGEFGDYSDGYSNP